VPFNLAFPSRWYLRPLAFCLAASMLLGVPVIAVAAETARNFQVAAAPLGQALRQFAGQAGILLSAEGRLTQGKTSGGVRATVSISAGLQQLLAGTGLIAVQLADGSYIVRLAPPVATVDGQWQTLAPVKVTGLADDAYRRLSSSTANRSEQALINTPQAVSIVTGQLIRDQAMLSMADAMRYMPGVGTAAGEGNRDTAIFRGNSSTSDFYIDGMRDDVQYYRDFYNVDSVEAVKGPNAMIFGRGGAGGIINRVSKQPLWTDAASATVSLGAWQARRAMVDAQANVGENAAVRVNAMAEDSASFRQGVQLRRAGINPTFAWRAGPATRVSIGYEHFRDDRVTDRGVPSYRGRPFATDPSTFFGNAGASPSWVRIDAFSALVEHDLGDGATLRNRTRYADYDKFYQNAFPSAISADGSSVTVLAYNSATVRRNLFNQTDVSWAVESGGMRHQLGAGLELGRQRTDNLRNTGYFLSLGDNVTRISLPTSRPVTDLPITFRPSATDADNHGVADTAAVYLQDQLTFSPHWQAIVGLRHERFTVDFLNRRTGERLKRSDSPWSPRAALVYKPMEAVSLYASLSQAFLPRAGEQLASLTPDNQAFEPERFRNVEVGAKWEATPALSASAAVYQLERSNVAVIDPADSQRSVLVDGQRSRGLELELNGKLTPSWQIAGGYAWQQAVLTATQSSGAVAGASVAHVPRHSLSLWSRYDFTPAWGAALGLIVRSPVFAAVSNTVSLPGYGRLDGALYYRPSPHFALQLNLDNLLNQQYYASAHSNDNIAPGTPRFLRVSASWFF